MENTITGRESAELNQLAEAVFQTPRGRELTAEAAAKVAERRRVLAAQRAQLLKGSADAITADKAEAEAQTALDRAHEYLETQKQRRMAAQYAGFRARADHEMRVLSVECELLDTADPRIAALMRTLRDALMSHLGLSLAAHDERTPWERAAKVDPRNVSPAADAVNARMTRYKAGLDAATELQFQALTSEQLDQRLEEIAAEAGVGRVDYQAPQPWHRRVLAAITGRS